MVDGDGSNPQITPIERMVAKTCFCKLRAQCEDKNSTQCMRHRNIVAEFMLAKHSTSTT